MRSTALLVALVLLHPSPLWAQTTFSVNTADDVDDGTCDAAHCSLREAIRAANANAGADVIGFNISGPGPHTIQPTSGLPAITDPVVIDGYTQPGAMPNTNGPGLGSNAVLKIELDGTDAGSAAGLRINAANSTVRGLVINRFNCQDSNDCNAVLITGAGATGNSIEGNFIGTDVTGTSALGNTRGVRIGDGASNNIVGGTTAEVRNVISGNTFQGVVIFAAGTTGNLVQGNFIGTDVTGAVPLPNGAAGVSIERASNNTIGGTTAEVRNVISGNASAGVSLGFDVTGNLVQGNFIGTDVTGTAAIGNGAAGVILDGAASNTIGGTTGAARNVISGNSGGVVLVEGAAGSVVQGNFIGTDVTGTSAIGNGDGVISLNSTNTIGGTSVGAGNTIAFNTHRGVYVISGTGSAILSNSIFSNGQLGIDLDALGVSANDEGDGDTGANNLQNFPSLTSALRGNSTAIEGTLNSIPSTSFRLEFFSSVTCDPSDHGEGETYLETTDVTTDASGNAGFTVTLTSTVSDPYITATATDPNDNTSEFSECLEVSTDFAIAVTPSEATVDAGQSATYTVTISPLGGSLDDPVSLACSGLPSLTSCSFAPASVTPGASDATSTLTVTTTAPSASAAPSLGQGGAIPVYPRWPGWLWLGLAGLALVTVVLRGLASRNRLLCLHVPAVVVLLVVAHLAACGGDGDGVNGPSDGTPGTPTGTFTFTITGTSGSLEHATTATLIVQ